MTAIIKRHRSKAAKIASAVLFALLMFVNIQLTTNPNRNGDIDLFGMKITITMHSAYARNDIKGPQSILPCPDGSIVYHCYNSSGLCGINDTCLD